MRRQRTILTFSSRVYRLLLLAYPARFRQEYGTEMAQVFRDDLRGTLRESGASGLVGLWFLVLFDLFKTALAEQLWEVFHMPVEKLERWSGVAAALGGALFIYIFVTDSGASDFTRILLFLLPLLALWALALTGLYRRLPARSQPGKRLALGLGLLSILSIAAGVLWLDLTEADAAWFLLILGFYGLTAGIASLGIIALRHGSLGLWRPVPLLLAAFFVGFLASGNEYDTVDNPVQLTFIILAGIGWVVLGLALWTGEERTAEPGLPA